MPKLYLLTCTCGGVHPWRVKPMRFTALWKEAIQARC